MEDELHEAMLITIPALSVASKLNLQQIVLPTRSGLLLCQIFPDAPRRTFIFARTWIARSPDSSRQHVEAGNAVVSLYTAIGGQAAVAEYLAALPLSEDHLDMPIPDDACEALRKCTWLQEPVLARDDPVGETWRLALSQRDRSTDAEDT